MKVGDIFTYERYEKWLVVSYDEIRKYCMLYALSNGAQILVERVATSDSVIVRCSKNMIKVRIQDLIIWRRRAKIIN